MGRSLQVIAPNDGVVAHRERTAEREFSELGFDSRLRRPKLCDATCPSLFTERPSSALGSRTASAKLCDMFSRFADSPVVQPLENARAIREMWVRFPSGGPLAVR